MQRIISRPLKENGSHLSLSEVDDAPKFRVEEYICSPSGADCRDVKEKRIRQRFEFFCSLWKNCLLDDEIEEFIGQSMDRQDGIPGFTQGGQSLGRMRQ